MPTPMADPTRSGSRRWSGGSAAGFTLIELMLVILMLGILSSILIQKFINIAEVAEITAEDTTIDLLRANLVNTLGEQLLRHQTASFPDDPFSNLTKTPPGYQRFRTTKPTGAPTENDLWMFLGGSQASGQITPEEAGTTLATFRVDGLIYHQRRDQTVVRWAYDSSTGVISRKFIDKKSPSKQEQDLDAQARGDVIPESTLSGTR
ncbi:MAG: type II secretion system protein [Nitrospinaceae bacterium]